MNKGFHKHWFLIVLFGAGFKVAFPFFVYGTLSATVLYAITWLYCRPIKKRNEENLRTLMEEPLSKEAHELLKLFDEYRFKHIVKIVHFL